MKFKNFNAISLYIYISMHKKYIHDIKTKARIRKKNFGFQPKVYMTTGATVL